MHLPVVLEKAFKLLPPVFQAAYKNMRIETGNLPLGLSTLIKFKIKELKTLNRTLVP